MDALGTPEFWLTTNQSKRVHGSGVQPFSLQHIAVAKSAWAMHAHEMQFYRRTAESLGYWSVSCERYGWFNWPTGSAQVQAALSSANNIARNNF